MRAMVLDRPGARLRPATLPDPRPGPGQVLLCVCARRRSPCRSSG
jgi:NADPH:quinone reductase-like Zn-dependent oxidoreductase